MRRTIKIEVREPQYTVDTHVTFAQADDWFGHTSQDLRMDIIYPEQGQKRSPCIVWICGGAWQQMSTGAHLAYLAELARSGFVVASVQYRTSNQTVFPGQLCDVKAAVRYLRAHADRYCIDRAQIGVMGESAGGHLAALAALTGESRQFDRGWYLEESSAVQAACTWYLPSDISRMPVDRAKDMQAAPESLLIGKNAAYHREEAMQACPVSYVTKAAPPFLLLHGTGDRTVPFSQSEILYEALQAAGADAELIAVEGADHADLQFFQRELWEIIIRFFRGKLGGGKE